MFETMNEVIAEVLKRELEYSRSPWQVECETYLTPLSRDFNNARMVIRAVTHHDFNRGWFEYGNARMVKQLVSEIREKIAGLYPPTATSRHVPRMRVPPMRVPALTLARVRRGFRWMNR